MFKHYLIYSSVLLCLNAVTKGFVSNTNVHTSEKPLILTPYIKSGKIQEARKLSKVHLDGSMNIQSYSGYFTVNDECNSNIFFWYFPPDSGNVSNPTILWLNGGPGESSLYGLFNEIGPFALKDNKTLELRKYRWTQKGGLLFFDNPVCTGFSFTDSSRSKCFSHNEDDVRKNLYNATVQFFQLFPELQKNDFYIFGESYGGKYTPGLAYTIHENKEHSKVMINLKGMGIGDGWCDPVHQLNYSSYLYNIGLLGNVEKIDVEKLEETVIKYLEEKKWYEGYKALYHLAEYMQRNVGNISPFNYLKNMEGDDGWKSYVRNHTVKEALHTGNIEFEHCAKDVRSELGVDFVKSVKPWIEKLLEHYPIIFYNGLVDVIVGAPLTRNFIQHLNWSGASDFGKKKQEIYYAKKNIPYAYGKHSGNLAVLKVRNAGHMVPLDQSYFAYLIFEDFLSGRFSNS